jgi:hypothetical protein
MEIVGSVAKDEVPEGRTPSQNGIWTGLARRAVEDHKQGRVTMIQVTDNEEYKRMRNGTHDAFRQLGYQLFPVIVDQPDGMRIFLEVEERKSAPTNGTVKSPRAPIRRRR